MKIASFKNEIELNAYVTNPKNSKIKKRWQNGRFFTWNRVFIVADTDHKYVVFSRTLPRRILDTVAAALFRVNYYALALQPKKIIFLKELPKIAQRSTEIAKAKFEPVQIAPKTGSPESVSPNLEPVLTPPKTEFLNSGIELEQTRKIPPRGRNDRIERHRSEEVRYFLDDHEITEKLPIVKISTTANFQSKEELRQVKNSPVPIFFTRHGKAILQQQGRHGCTAAATGMLILDCGKTISVNKLKTRIGFGSDTNTMVKDLEAAGLKPIVSEAINIDMLKTLLEKNGSAIISIDDKIEMGVESHVIVVDEINAAGIRLRDPYHGWEITIKEEPFKKIMIPTEVIQVA